MNDSDGLEEMCFSNLIKISCLCFRKVCGCKQFTYKLYRYITEH